MLSKNNIIDLFKELDLELENEKVKGEIYLVGGAVMCLVYNARPSTKNVDAYFIPKSRLKKIAEDIAKKKDLPIDWLNDAVKGFLSKHAEYSLFADYPNLKILVANPEYLLSMKCLSMRLGEEFHDEDDVRFLLRYLNIAEFDKAIKVITKYYPLEMFPQKTLYALEEILS